MSSVIWARGSNGHSNKFAGVMRICAYVGEVVTVLD